MKRKSERVYTKLHKMPTHNAKNNNSVKLKHLRRNKPSKIQVDPYPTEADKLENKKKHFMKKFKNGDFKLACIVKFLKLLLELDKLLHKLAKNIKFIKSMTTMEILHDKSNMRLTTLLTKNNTSSKIINNMGVIIPDPNTRNNNATESSSSPCPSSTEATILKNTFHGH